MVSADKFKRSGCRDGFQYSCVRLPVIEKEETGSAMALPSVMSEGVSTINSLGLVMS